MRTDPSCAVLGSDAPTHPLSTIPSEVRNDPQQLVSCHSSDRPSSTDNISRAVTSREYSGVYLWILARLPSGSGQTKNFPGPPRDFSSLGLLSSVDRQVTATRPRAILE